jgi:hypothetical protein
VTKLEAAVTYGDLLSAAGSPSTSTFKSSGDSSEPAGGFGGVPPQPVAATAVTRQSIKITANRQDWVTTAVEVTDTVARLLRCELEGDGEVTACSSSLSSCC